MNDIVEIALTPILAHLTRDGDLETSLVNLREPVKTLRNQYWRGDPDFSTESARLAYSVAYHPYHAHLAFMILNRFADAIELDGPVARIAILGAGPAPELLALAKFLRQYQHIKHLEVDLIDREPGWIDIRRLTVDASLATVWRGTYEVRHHTLDLSDATEAANAADIVRNHSLVFAQALFTELHMRSAAETFMNRLIDTFGDRSLLLATDFSKMSGFSESLNAVGDRNDLRILRTVHDHCPMPRAPAALSALYTGASGLIERRGAEFEARLYVRPSWMPATPTRASENRNIPDQDHTLEQLGEFLENKRPGVFVLTGSAGTGKTYLIAQAARHAEMLGRFVELWAPTGQAARRLGRRTGMTTSTIHAALYGSPKRIHRGEEIPPQTSFERRSDGVHGRVVFIDESSLIGNEITSDNFNSDVMFGAGKLLEDILRIVTAENGQVVFVGDRYQLPPFGEERSLALDVEYLADRGLDCRHAELSTINRQKENSGILQLAESCMTAIDNQTDLPTVIEAISDDVRILPRDTPGWILDSLLDGTGIAVTFRHADASLWNRRARERGGRTLATPMFGDRLVTVEAARQSGLTNGEELSVVEVLDEHRIALRDESLDLLRVTLSHVDPGGTTTQFDTWLVKDLLYWASVDQLHNARRLLWVNFVMRARDVGLEPGTDEFFDFLAVDEYASALRCMYAYARTCQRAQGGEWDLAICDMSGTESQKRNRNRLGYTALTRAKGSAWLRKWPETKQASDVAPSLDELIEFAKGQLEAVVGRPVVVVEHNKATHVSLRLAADDRSLMLDLWHTMKNRVVQSPPGLDLTEVSSRIEAWVAEQQIRQPPDECLDPMIESLERWFDSQSIDVECHERSNYQVEIRIRSARTEAFVVFFYRAHGLLTKEVAAGGDPNLQTMIRQAVDPYLHSDFRPMQDFEK